MSIKSKPLFRLAVAAKPIPDGELVRQSFLSGSESLPAIYEPATAGVDLVEWVRLNSERIDRAILRFGGVLFRGFENHTVEEFHQVARVLGESPVTFASNIFPRTDADRTSLRAGSIYPPQLKLAWHNENSFDECRWTRKIMFYARHPAVEGGETPICDGRKLLAAIDPSVSREFMRRGITYIRNYHPELGNSWRIQFNASTREEVETYCQQWDIDFEWLAGDCLRTRCRRPAVIRHPETRELIWFNALQMWHTYGVAADVLAAWQGSFAPEDYPMNCSFGDGGAVDDALMAEIYRAYGESETIFGWRPGDVLILDNLLVTHGRNPFVGPREHYVALDRQICLREIPLEDRGLYEGSEK